MKKSFFIIVGLTTFSAFRFWDDLVKYKVNVPEFREKIVELAAVNTFPNFRFYLPKDVKDIAGKLPAAEQAAMARAVGAFAKSYVSSSAFVADFGKSLDAQKQNTDPNSSELKEVYTEKYNEFLNETTEMVKAGILNEDYFKTQQQMLDGLKPALEKPNPYGDTPEGKATYTTEIKGIKQMVGDLEAMLAIKPLLPSNKAEFAKKYAAIRAKSEVNQRIDNNIEKNAEIDAKKNYKANIKAQLQQFLDESAEVDFSAEVKQINGVREFVNEDYRRKPPVWKQCYRMGKPATMELRKMAEDWQKEL
ncbi:MAG: hypothetical protein U0X91_18650 [Spirosomataceae bacterium]